MCTNIFEERTNFFVLSIGLFFSVFNNIRHFTGFNHCFYFGFNGINMAGNFTDKFYLIACKGFVFIAKNIFQSLYI